MIRFGPGLDEADRLKRRRITGLVLSGLTVIGLALWFAEAEEVAVARSVVWMVGHPLVAVPIFFAGVGVALAIVVGALALMRRMFPPLPGDQNLFTPFFRWLNAVPPGAPAESSSVSSYPAVPDQLPDWVIRSAQLQSPPGGQPPAAEGEPPPASEPPPRARRMAVGMMVASVAVAALSGGVYLLAGHGPSMPSGAKAIGACSPAPCASLAGSALYVLSVDNNYSPNDLTPTERGFLDGAQPPAGFRYVRVTVRLDPPAGVRAPNPAKSVKLFDGAAERTPTALLAVDPACHISSPPAPPGVPRGPVSMCFIARDLHPRVTPSLVWMPTGTRIPL